MYWRYSLVLCYTCCSVYTKLVQLLKIASTNYTSGWFTLLLFGVVLVVGWLVGCWLVGWCSLARSLARSLASENERTIVRSLSSLVWLTSEGRPPSHTRTHTRARATIPSVCVLCIHLPVLCWWLVGWLLVGWCSLARSLAGQRERTNDCTKSVKFGVVDERGATALPYTHTHARARNNSVCLCLVYPSASLSVWAVCVCTFVHRHGWLLFAVALLLNFREAKTCCETSTQHLTNNNNNNNNLTQTTPNHDSRNFDWPVRGSRWCQGVL